MPRFLNAFVPVGILGIMIAAMLAADMSTDSSYMLTWGSVIYNDILAPFRKGKEFSEKRGLLWNRMIVAMIGLFLLFYGLWYNLEGDVLDYLYLTGTIYMASISILLISACYWPRANSWGAVATIIIGATIPLLYLVLTQFWRVPVLDASGAAVMANGVAVTESPIVKLVGPAWSGVATFALAGLGMVIGSLLKPGNKTTNPTMADLSGENNA
jgi:SSS family solute:Na+ symporter